MIVSKTKVKSYFWKKCEHEGCVEKFYTNKTAQRFCKIHQNYKYIKKKLVDETNQIIEHDNKSAKKITAICECCLKEFEITLIPKVKKYPKYCEEHRNEHKRLVYLKEKI